MSSSHPRHFGFAGATSVLVANMVGTGVFTSLGFQALDLHTGGALLSLWIVGGVVALCGAIAYAELGALLPRSGGEYVYLGQAWHPLAGFLGGWVSMTVGFAAPIALSSMAFGRYLSAIVPVDPRLASLGMLAFVVAVHLAGLHAAKRFQIAITATQLCLVAAFVVAGLTFARPVPLDMGLTGGVALREVLSAPYAVSLVYVSFAFTGWNAAGYIAGEIVDPERTIPRAVVASTLLVTVLYLLLNFAFLRTVPLAEVAGKVEVGALSARAMFGARGGQAMSGIIAAVLLASISSMVIGSSRVTQAVAESLPQWRVLGARGADGVPRNAILAQGGLILVLLLTNSFEAVMLYAGFTLNLMSLLTVLGMMRLRRTAAHQVRPYHAWGYPLTPLVYVALSLWTLGTLLVQRPGASLAGLGTVVVGVGIWMAGSRRTG
ncbi:amino acid permease [Gemmatimonas sp.]|uniref:APC family permease n=1 Tax=Gemmatimonas sp. TaxID=1962908 RepID=UPI0022CCC114|nr:amino acid permease [Gemmatimonas sp.]MCZ8204957.1 amino acid permease [Gemmatimonas sp.]